MEIEMPPITGHDGHKPDSEQFCYEIKCSWERGVVSGDPDLSLRMVDALETRVSLIRRGKNGIIFCGGTAVDIVRVRAVPDADKVNLIGLADRRFYRFHPLVSEKKGLANFCTGYPGRSGEFLLEECIKDETSDLLNVSEKVFDVLEGAEKADVFLRDAIKSGQNELVRIAPLLLSSIPIFELESVAASLAAESDLLAVLAEVVAEDAWARAAFEYLHAYFKGVRPPAVDVAGLELDGIAIGSRLYQRGIATPWLPLICAIRKISQPVSSWCVVATAKNEGVYLCEWISHYLQLGAKEIIIYTNDNEDGSDALLERLAELGVIRLVRNVIGDGVSAQDKAYAHALSVSTTVLDYKWALFVDVDEFLLFNVGVFEAIDDYLNWQEIKHSDAVAINRVVNCGARDGDWLGKGVIDRLEHFSYVEPHVKCFLRPASFITSQAHFPRTEPRQAAKFRSSDSGDHITKNNGLPHSIELANSERPLSGFAILVHYLYKTVDEYIWRHSRNRGDHRSYVEEGRFSMDSLKFITPLITSIESGGNSRLEDIIKNDFGLRPIVQDKTDFLSDELINAALSEIRTLTAARLARVRPKFIEFLSNSISSAADDDERQCLENALNNFFISGST